jgi:pilus assembly protein CpaD
MRKNTKLLRAGVVLTALCTAGCAIPTVKDAAITEDYRYRYPITVAPEMRTLRVPYAGVGAGLDPSVRSQLQHFVSEYKSNGAGAISVSAPDGRENVALEFAGHVAQLGVPRDQILLGTNPTPQPGSEIELGYISYTAETKECGNWSEDLGTTRDNSPFLNLGCATQNNIAAMVADPRDLIGPQPMSPGDTQRRMTVLEKYRAGEPTPTERTEDQSGAVSLTLEN